MFPDLPAARFDDDRLLALGIEGGLCDGGACDTESHIEAGQPFFGQYVAHDLTADRSPLRVHGDVNTLRNARTPRANLEALYGAGPVGAPYLFDQTDPAKLLLSVGGRDLPRNQQGIALIGDPRNDVHGFMTGLQVAFIQAHNRLVDQLRADGVPESELFDDARRALIWHYQWVILNDFLPNLIGSAMTTSVLQDGLRFYHLTGDPFIPVEFADAALMCLADRRHNAPNRSTASCPHPSFDFRNRSPAWLKSVPTDHLPRGICSEEWARACHPVKRSPTRLGPER